MAPDPRLYVRRDPRAARLTTCKIRGLSQQAGTEPHASETGQMSSITCWTRCAQYDNCCCGSRGRTFGRGTAVRDLRQSRGAQDGRATRGGSQLSFCYEAWPCGYGLHRFLRGLGHACSVVAPSLIPIKAAERIKTNGRDAVTVARLHRARGDRGLGSRRCP
jgi:hypothetical protein